MERQDWTVEFYRDERGREPVRDFLDGLRPQFADKAVRSLRLLESWGTQLAMPLARPMGGHPFWELRIQFSGDIARIFYFAVSGRRIVLLHGFVKKDQKTPRGELETADRRYADYLARRRT